MGTECNSGYMGQGAVRGSNCLQWVHEGRGPNSMYANPITVDSSLPKHNILEDEYCEEMHTEVQIIQKEMVLYHDLYQFPDAAIL